MNEVIAQAPTSSERLEIESNPQPFERRRLALMGAVFQSAPLRWWFAKRSNAERRPGFEPFVPVVKRRPPREMEPGLCRTGPHFQRRMMALEGSFRFSHSARSSSGIFVSVSGYPRQR